jgi:hypothetical protein
MGVQNFGIELASLSADWGLTKHNNAAPYKLRNTIQGLRLKTDEELRKEGLEDFILPRGTGFGTGTLKGPSGTVN